MNVVLHEARKPLNYFKSQVPNLGFWADQLKSEFKQDVLNELLAIAAGVSRNSEIFVKLFGRLDPLAAGKRGKKSSFAIKAAIESAAKVFEETLLSKKIDINISGKDEALATGHKTDSAPDS